MLAAANGENAGAIITNSRRPAVKRCSLARIVKDVLKPFHAPFLYPNVTLARSGLDSLSQNKVAADPHSIAGSVAVGDI